MSESRRPAREPASPADRIDTAAMWERLLLADEMSEDCLALEAGTKRGGERRPEPAGDACDRDG